MRLLLDTHAVVWWLLEPEKLQPRALQAIADPDAQIYVSAASLWEAGIKQAAGRLNLPPSLPDVLQESGFWPMPVTWEHAWRAGALPRHHTDPFDRLLVAQTFLEGLVLVTRDPEIQLYGCPTLVA